MKNEYNPKISIIVNCYNGQEFLFNALDSVIKQTYSNWELIFWDNRSTDESSQIFKKFNQKNFKYFLSKHHTLLYEARDNAIDKASGELIAFLDTDDYWEKNKLSRQVEQFRDQKVALCCSNFWIRNEKKNKVSLAFKKNTPNKKNLDNFLKNNFVNISTLVLRKKVYDILEYGFDKEYEMIGDFDLVVRMMQISDLKFINEPLSTYRWHANNLSNKKIFLNNEEKFKWLEKNRNNQIILNNPSYDYFVSKVKFYQILNLIYMNKRSSGFKELLKVKTKKYKTFALIALLTPISILKILRS
tara:strand:- start:23609 stop:24511 length:903 start_codon:yes stop_codon:yes gene_type:complete